MAPRGRRTWILLACGLALAGLGIALATSPPARPKNPPAPAPVGTVDCAALEKSLRACALPLVKAVDPEAAGRLDKMDPALRKTVVRTFTDELLSKTVTPCQRRRGRLAGAAPVAACVPKGGATGAEACQRMARCLQAAFAKLPPPKSSK